MTVKMNQKLASAGLSAEKIPFLVIIIARLLYRELSTTFSRADNFVVNDEL